MTPAKLKPFRAADFQDVVEAIAAWVRSEEGGDSLASRLDQGQGVTAMTPTEMDEACRLAGVVDSDGYYRMGRDDFSRLARALLAAVRERDDARAIRDEHFREIERSRAIIADARIRLDDRQERLDEYGKRTATATARAVAAEQRAEAAELAIETGAAGLHLCRGEAAIRTTERARVVEAIAVWHDDNEAAEAVRSDNDSDPWQAHLASARCDVHADAARHIRTTNWAAPEEES